MSNTIEGPFHQHDCRNCQFIASTHNARGDLSDWYICERDDTSKYTVLRRDSDQGSDYSSWPHFILEGPQYVSGVNSTGQKAMLESHLLANAMLAIHRKRTP